MRKANKYRDFSTGNIYRHGGNLRLNNMSSNKGSASKRKIYVGDPTDKSHRVIYQIGKDGSIERQWDSVQEIVSTLGVDYATVRAYIKNEKLVGSCLFVLRTNYKTTIDYCVLIKYIKYKMKNKIKN